MFDTLFIASFSATWVAALLARKVGLLDLSSGRKQHKGAIPLTGGAAIYLTFLAANLLLAEYTDLYPMLAVATVIFAVGLYDDIHGLDAKTRLLTHYACGILLATYAGIHIIDVGNLLGFGSIPLLALSVPLTALSVAGLCNAYNMIDGIDGLAAAISGLPFLVLYWLSVQAGHPIANVFLLLLVPMAVFLLFNLGPNNLLLPKIFLGDGGSTSLGFLVTVALVYCSQGENSLIRPVTALWLTAVPLMDMLATMLRRLKLGHEVTKADRSHLHHTLMNLGLGPRQTLVLMLTWAVACAAMGMSLERAPEYLSLLCYLALFLAHYLFVMQAETIGRWLGRAKAANPDNQPGARKLPVS